MDGPLECLLGFGSEESAGATFLRRDGTVWATDKDGLVPCLLAAEITAVAQRQAVAADMIMVKPAMPYLDLIWQARDRFEVPIAAYHTFSSPNEEPIRPVRITLPAKDPVPARRASASRKVESPSDARRPPSPV